MTHHSMLNTWLVPTIAAKEHHLVLENYYDLLAVFLTRFWDWEFCFSLDIALVFRSEWVNSEAPDSTLYSGFFSLLF